MAAKNISKLVPEIRLSIANPKTKSGSVFGKGIASLCKGVREKGSLNAAAKEMGMAYSKAWRIIKETEEALGTPLLIRDGAHGSVLTDDGEKLVNIYDSLSEELSKKAVELFQEATK